MEIDSDLAYRLKELCKTAARDESRPVLETVHIESGPERTILVTADGFRLAAMALPITSEEPFGLHVDAESMGKLMKKGELGVTPSGVSINGIVLPNVELYGNFPFWRSIIPDLDPEPRANIAVFRASYITDFLKYRFGKDYNKPSTHAGYLHWSIYNRDTCGVSDAHAWAWKDWEGRDYLYILMPMNMIDQFGPSGSDPDPVAWKDGFTQLEKLLSERLMDSVKEVTTEIPWEVWDERKSNETTD